MLCMILCTISFLLPFENFIINFKSPEEVFNYCYWGNIEDIVYGDNSCMIIYSKEDNSYSHAIIPKNKNGYKIPNIFSVEKISDKLDKNAWFKIFTVKDTENYYFLGNVNSNEKEIDIYNGNGEKIKTIYTNNDNSSIKFFYFYFNNYEDNYYLLVENQKIYIK